MLRFISIFIAAGLLGIYALSYLLGDNYGPAYTPVEINLAPKEIDTSVFDARVLRSDVIKEQVYSSFTDAPNHILEIATGIANKDVSISEYSEKISALSSEEVNKGYGKPFAAKAPQYENTLLRLAVKSGNTGAAALLLDQGASVFYNDNEIAFQSVSLMSHDSDQMVWFPDYRLGSKFLRIWLDRGGDPNITHPVYGDDRSFLLSQVPIDNLEATLNLLEAGADPWQPIDVHADSGEFLYQKPNYFTSLVTGHKIHAEVAFRIALGGFYKNGPSDKISDLKRSYERLAGKYLAENLRSADIGIAWGLKKSISLIYKEMGEAPGKNVAKLLSRRLSSEAGGFFLAPGETRSPNKHNQKVTSRETQFGAHKWLSVK